MERDPLLLVLLVFAALIVGMLIRTNRRKRDTEISAYDKLMQLKGTGPFAKETERKP